MSNEPLRLTLEEALRAVINRAETLRSGGDSLHDVRMEIVDGGWWVFFGDGGGANHIKEFGPWPEAASFALGRPVLERDDRAELIDALTEAVALANRYLDNYIDADNWADELEEKWPEELEADAKAVRVRLPAIVAKARGES